VTERIKISGDVVQLANKPNNVASKVRPDDLEQFFSLAESHLIKCNSLIRDYYLGYLGENEELITELMRLSYNSKTFKDYSAKLISNKEPQEDNLIHLFVDELTNVTKCAMSLIESKSHLMLYGVSLDQQ